VKADIHTHPLVCMVVAMAGSQVVEIMVISFISTSAFDFCADCPVFLTVTLERRSP
jgi:hypothetical protein